MKNLYLTIAIACLSLSAMAQKNTLRYFEYGVQFTLKGGCKSGAEGTMAIDHGASYDEIFSFIQKWVYPEKISVFKIWYLNEISKGEMYVFDEPFNCNGKHTYSKKGMTVKQIKILNQKK